MKTILKILLIGLLTVQCFAQTTTIASKRNIASGVGGGGSETLIDSYSESLGDGYSTVSEAKSIGQTFLGNGMKLSSCKFFLTNYNHETLGNAVVKLYGHSGTFGSSGVPNGILLATSSSTDLSAVPYYPSFILTEFVFDRTFTLVNGTHYTLCISFDGVGSNAIAVEYSFSSPTAPGNLVLSNNGIDWTAYAGGDACFYVYGVN